METDYSTPLITVFGENPIQQKRLPTSLNNVVLFFSYGDKLLNTFNYCMQWNLDSTKKYYHVSEHCGIFVLLWRQIPLQWKMWYFFQLWRQINQPLSLMYAVKPQSNKNIFPLQLTMWYLFSVMEIDPTSVNKVVLFLSYGDRLINLFNFCMQWNLNLTKTSSHFSEQRGTFFSYGERT